MEGGGGVAERRRLFQRKQSLSTRIISRATHPLHVISRGVARQLPFTKKGSAVLIRGRVCYECENGKGEAAQAALTVVKFRGSVSPGDAEPGRYHLLISHGDPWAHRTLLAHSLAGLNTKVGIIASDGMWPLAKGLPAVATRGWRFSKRGEWRRLLQSCSSEVKQAVNRGSLFLHDLYVASEPEATGRVTIPVRHIVNNDSSAIVRILHQVRYNAYALQGHRMAGMNAPNLVVGIYVKDTPWQDLRRLGSTGIDLYPEAMREEIDRVRLLVYRFSAGVYKCGIASSREGYEKGLAETFAALRECEKLLENRPYLAGDALTECDVFAFPTLVRFDIAYYTAFRCNKKRLRDFPNLSRYVERMASIAEVRKTVDMATYLCVAFIEAPWEGRIVGNMLRLFEGAVDVFTGAATPGSSWLRRALARSLTLPARMLQTVFR